MSIKCVELKKEVIDTELCTKCGTCIGICPTNSFQFRDGKLEVLEDKCVDCGLCVKVCPGKYFDYKAMNQNLYGSDYDSSSRLGTYKSIYAGYSMSDTTRNAAASGGIITEISKYLLKNKMVDGVITIANREGESTSFGVKVARSVDEVEAAAQSKYTVIPTNEILKTILKENGKYAYIGLPCQIHGLRKAMEVNPTLKERIGLTVGLFCGFNMDNEATEYLIHKSKISKSDITELSYRKKIGDETGFYVAGGGKEYFVNKHEYTFMNLIFSPKRCLKCYDYSAEFSDISVGDAWEYGQGWSRIIVRTEAGQSLINEMVQQKCIRLEASSAEAIYNSQKKILSHKKRDIWYRWDKMKNIPEINIGDRPKDLQVNIKGKLQYYITVFSNNPIGRKLCYLLPFSLLRKVSKALRK